VAGELANPARPRNQLCQPDRTTTRSRFDQRIPVV